MIVALATLIAVSLVQQEDWPKPGKKLTYGPLTIEVYVSRTAHLFHVVDQISAWDNACHGQYRSHMQLSSEDEEALRKYAEVRSKRRWGQGLEQTFYVPLELEEAAKAGKKNSHITHEELEVILPVLERFAPRVDLRFKDKQTSLAGAFDAVDREWLTSAVKEVARFTGVSKLTILAFPLASPEQGGGGMDGGRLRWEIGPEGMEQSVLLHELVHGFFMQKDELLQATVERTPGLTMTYLGEGFAYAFSPGLYGPKDRDVLGGNVASDRSNGQAWQDPNYGRQREYALALRPLLSDALANGQMLEAFLPRARDAWLALREVEEARGAPTLFYTGPAGKVVHDRLIDGRYKYSMYGFNNRAEQWKERLSLARTGDLFVVTLASDHDDRPLPSGYDHFLPLAPEEVERRIERGKVVAEERSVDGLRVVLLAASTRTELEELARTTPLLDIDG